MADVGRDRAERTRREELEGFVVQRRVTTASADRLWRNWLLGRPLATADAPHQTVGKSIGLALFGSDALSSTAYATQEMLLVLSVAGAASMSLAPALSVGIAILMWIVALSYWQTVHAYPGGGGAFTVGRENLGNLAGAVAGAALLTDYILTVAVSVSSGVAQVVSAFPVLYSWRTVISVLCILAMMMINLRGVRESGAIFAGPVYLFVLMTYVMVFVGLIRYFTGNLGVVTNPPEVVYGSQALTFFLVLRAFSGGTVAMTGVEAISNGVTAFREPRSHNAGITLFWMVTILSTLLVGITFLAVKVGAVPSEIETVISQLARTVYGERGVLYLVTVAMTTLILILAANTAFSDFPRLGAVMGTEGFLPRQLSFKGSRLVYSHGIVLLSFVACALVIGFRASVSALIPLYAVGVFVSFTISQSGMVIHWLRVARRGRGVDGTGSSGYEAGWQWKAAMNLVGAVCTGVVALTFAVTKFREGAWVVMILIPLMVGVFYAIHRHYAFVAKRLSLEDYGVPERVSRHRVIVPIGGVHRGTLKALQYARLLSDDVTAVYVATDPAKTEEIRKKWASWRGDVRLVILESPYRLLIEPLLEYIEDLSRQRQPNELITVVVPHFVSTERWANLLHGQTASILRNALLYEPEIIITEVPYLIGRESRKRYGGEERRGDQG